MNASRSLHPKICSTFQRQIDAFGSCIVQPTAGIKILRCRTAAYAKMRSTSSSIITEVKLFVLDQFKVWLNLTMSN